MLIIHSTNKIGKTDYYIPFEGTTFRIDLDRGLVYCHRPELPEGGICIAEYGNYLIHDDEKRLADNTARIRTLMREINDKAIRAEDNVIYYDIKEYEPTRPVFTAN
jgi:hypothetical protein